MAMEALYSGISGLKVHQEMLDVVGNNLANTNTTGFKSQTANFSDMVYQTLKEAAAASSSTLGGTNPIQIGSGAQVATVSPNLQQGSLQQTGGELDVALEGAGYFVVRDGTQPLYTRAGSFGIDSNHFLVDPATGNRVQRFGAVGEGTATSPAFQTPGDNDITIPVGTVIPGTATSTVNLQGNLSASATGPLAQILTSTQPFQSGGSPATAATTLNSLGDNVSPYALGDTITLQGIDGNGAAYNVSVPVDNTTTMGDLVNAINANVPGATASLSAAGNLVVTANTTGASQLGVSITDGGTNVGQSNWGNHLLPATTTGKAGDTFNTSIQIYDPQGTAHTLNLTFQKQANNNWSLTGAINPSDGTMADNLVNNILFNPDGSFNQITGTGLGNATMSVQFNGFGAPQTLNFNLGASGGFQGVTQTGGPSSAVATGQNGYASGTLASLDIGTDGIIHGVFSNGQILDIAQLAIAKFANPAALDRVGDNYYALTAESGAAMIGAGQSGGIGAVRQKELESSNVDISLEFTRLIIAQQGYQVNAHVITEADLMLQALTNIIH